MKKTIKLLISLTLCLICVIMMCSNSFAGIKIKYAEYTDASGNYYVYSYSDDENSTPTLSVTIKATGENVRYSYGGSIPTFTIADYYSQYGVQTSWQNNEIQSGILGGIWKRVPENPLDKGDGRDKKTTVDLDEVTSSADAFLQKGVYEQIPEEKIQNISGVVYSVLLTIGIIIAAIVGAMLGIKFITSGLDGRAEVKQMLLPYGIGVVVLFGAFTIWKVVLTILQN